MDDYAGRVDAYSEDRSVRIGGNVLLQCEVTAVMSDMDEIPLASTAECVVHLKRVLHCLDEVLPGHAPDQADQFALAGAYVQQVIDLLN